LPAGVAHRRIASLILILILGGTVYAYDDLVSVIGTDSVFEYTFLFCLGFLVGTYLLSPDLDLAGSDPARSWGIIQSIWRPYAWLFRHRGVSHTPIIGTLTRLLYLSLIIYILGTAAQSLMSWKWQISVSDLPHLPGSRTLCAFLGLVASDLAHLFADRFFSK
jgi:uncharacterized metal-binding protein